MKNKIKQVLINNMELFDENTGLMGIPDVDEKLEVIARDIMKLSKEQKYTLEDMLDFADFAYCHESMSYNDILNDWIKKKKKC